MKIHIFIAAITAKKLQK